MKLHNRMDFMKVLKKLTSLLTTTAIIAGLFVMPVLAEETTELGFVEDFEGSKWNAHSNIFPGSIFPENPGGNSGWIFGYGQVAYSILEEDIESGQTNRYIDINDTRPDGTNNADAWVRRVFDEPITNFGGTKNIEISFRVRGGNNVNEGVRINILGGSTELINLRQTLNLTDWKYYRFVINLNNTTIDSINSRTYNVYTSDTPFGPTNPGTLLGSANRGFAGSGATLQAIDGIEFSLHGVNTIRASFDDVKVTYSTTITSNTQDAFDISESSLTVMSGKDYVITQTSSGTATANTITVPSGYRGTISLNGVNIASTTANSAPISVKSGANVNFILNGTNTLNGTASSSPGLHVEHGAMITIKAATSNDNASGTLIATSISNTTSAGIGGLGSSAARSGNTGRIIINSGTINATGGLNGAGIGGGRNGIGMVIINGGAITATGGRNGAGIGGGNNGDPGSNMTALVLVKNGEITATGGVPNPDEKNAHNGGAGIGGGRMGSGMVSIHAGIINAQNADTYPVADGSATAGSDANNGASAIGGGGTGWDDNSNGSASVIITGGTINATSYREGIAIGAGGGQYHRRHVANISISGGNVTAISNGTGSAIGGGSMTLQNNIIINISGGNVNASTTSATNNTAAIGGKNLLSGDQDTQKTGGLESQYGRITITGGVVTANVTGAGGHGIGNSLGNIATNRLKFTLDGDAVVSAKNINLNTTNDVTLTKGVLFLSNAGTVYNDVTLPADLTLTASPARILTIPAGTSLTIPSGKTLTNAGTITNNGTITSAGTFTNTGTVTSTGTFTNSGALVSAPAITSATMPDVIAGESYDNEIPYDGDVVTWNMPNDTLPDGITFDNTYGKLTGTTNAAVGEYSVTVEAIGSGGKFIQTLTFTVISNDPEISKVEVDGITGMVTVALSRVLRDNEILFAAAYDDEGNLLTAGIVTAETLFTGEAYENVITANAKAETVTAMWWRDLGSIKPLDKAFILEKTGENWTKKVSIEDE